MNLADGPLLLVAGGSLFFWGWLIGRHVERERPGGVKDLRRRLAEARRQVTILRRAFGVDHPAVARPQHLHAVQSGER